MDQIPDSKKVIADKIYIGCRGMALHNALDTKDVRESKRRAQACQESINARFKGFDILKNCFHHSILNHQVVVHAILVIVAIQINKSASLFPI